MSCVCDNCQRGEDEVEIHHTCEDCVADAEEASSTVGEGKVPPAVDKLWDLLLEVQSDTTEVARVLANHGDQLPERFMKVMAIIELSKSILDEAYPYRGADL
jgi:hypothetical protein